MKKFFRFVGIATASVVIVAGAAYLLAWMGIALGLIK